MRSFCYTARSEGERDSLREYALLCTREPGLVDLLLYAMRCQPTTVGFYREIKPRLMELVGREAKQPSLRNSQAYDCAYELLYSLVYDVPGVVA